MSNIYIDWSKMVTAEMKEAEADAKLLIAVEAELTIRRLEADKAISPLQDAVDLEMATPEEAALLTEWKRYRVYLSRVPQQVGYHKVITWPEKPVDA
ncbi:hypothetical protein vBPpSSYP_132 [Pseudomonas phage vB_PpS_SYP]|nr:hypothetical protein vBPpSSYP_132 [Pseudomonas phage vB_PpS_SYP]